jgi:hypothetical protein
LIFIDSTEYDVSGTHYGAMFLPQVLTAITASLLGAGLAHRISGTARRGARGKGLAQPVVGYREAPHGRHRGQDRLRRIRTTFGQPTTASLFRLPLRGPRRVMS